MALIKCPVCGEEISDKSSTCIHCGKILVDKKEAEKIEDNDTHRVCLECGKEIDNASNVCPFCGCPVEVEGNTVKSEHKKKKPIIFLIPVIAIIIIIALVINSVSPILNEKEKLAYQNAVTMKNMLKDPDSFKLYDEMFLLEALDDDGAVEYTYTIFKYGGTNSYGGVITDEAIFKDNVYIMDYCSADDIEEDDPNAREKLITMIEIELVLKSMSYGADTSYNFVDINIDKIKDKMGLK